MDQNTIRPSRFWERISFSIFCAIHLTFFAAFWTGVTWRAFVIAIVLFSTRMFVITAGYHRYFAHRAYKTSRFVQFLIGLFGTTCLQKGPLWWAATHRTHHRESDLPGDPHSPRQHGFWVSHIGWIMSRRHTPTNLNLVRDLARYPELRWLASYHWVAPLLLAISCYLVAGSSGLIVGFGCSTVFFWHATFTINSLAHVDGSQPYRTGDDSRNNWLLAILPMGEGWHNNHHYLPRSVKQGFRWWQIDISYYLLCAFERIGVIWALFRPSLDAIKAGRHESI